MENSIKLNLALIVICLCLMASIIYGIVYVEREGVQCLSNPFNYASQLAKDSTGSHLTCSCNFDTPTIQRFSFSSNPDYREINLSALLD